MKSLLSFIKSLFTSKKKSSTILNTSNIKKKSEFDFDIISKEERLANRCDKYDFIIE